MQNLALTNTTSATQDADALGVVCRKLIECSNVLVTSEETGAKIQNGEVTGRILAGEVFCSRSECLSGSGSTSCLPLVESFNDS
jgi:hypothetical protein